MPLEEYGYEVRFKLSEDASPKEEKRIYREIHCFEKKLNAKLRNQRAKLRDKRAAR